MVLRTDKLSLNDWKCIPYITVVPSTTNNKFWCGYCGIMGIWLKGLDSQRGGEVKRPYFHNYGHQPWFACGFSFSHSQDPIFVLEIPITLVRLLALNFWNEKASFSFYYITSYSCNVPGATSSMIVRNECENVESLLKVISCNWYTIIKDESKIDMIYNTLCIPNTNSNGITRILFSTLILNLFILSDLLRLEKLTHSTNKAITNL